MGSRKMFTHRCCQFGILIILGIAIQQTAAVSEAIFPYVLNEEHHAVAGRVKPDTYHGQRVVALLEGEGHGEGGEEHFLKIEKRRHGEPKFQATKSMDISMATPVRPTPLVNRHTQARLTSMGDVTLQDDAAPTLMTDSEHDHLHPSPHFNLPVNRAGHINVQDHVIHIVHKRNVDTGNKPVTTETTVVTTDFVVMDTTAFTVDEEGYIIVEDVTEIQEKDMIEFFVLLEDTSTRNALSNPLPFIIYVDRPETDPYPAVPAVFAGVLVLIVVFFAFFIPFVIRAKRRVKEGKPVLKLGSYASSANLERVDTVSSLSTRDSEPWNGPNSYYNYAVEVEHEKSHFGRDLKDYTRSHPPTIQLTKKSKFSSDESSSSGIDSQGGAEGTSADETLSQRL